MANPTFNAHDLLVIASALHDGAERHLNPHDLEFQESIATGHEYRSLLVRAFPDHAQSRANNDDMRKALAQGFMIPPGGATPDDIRKFLSERKAMQAARVDARMTRVLKRRVQPMIDPDDPDHLPF